ncbi:hypothetical protein HBN50_13100 [Halobacteriovorax sp. GB3]|uniref:hypothetical protein n=1 Tax=Halobacteriovorax sp. GB3 TaxID=2719615 RepID=UPI002360DC02|nr:hypothetical protein [Halobacteriovorax sp. GB3]MDD0854043.1 hypothetical protein [Halobacteriovorax sp. GB3]
MKFFIILCTILSLNSFSQTQKSRTRIHSMSNKALVNSFDSYFYEKFVLKVAAYNKSNKNPSKLLDGIKSKDLRKKMSDYLKNKKIDSLPKIELKEQTAYVNLGRTKIQFNTDTLFNKFILINGVKFYLNKTSIKDYEMAMKALLNYRAKTTLIDFFISPVYADDENFEDLTLATVILLGENFKEHSWCVFCDDEMNEATKSNFSKVMDEIAQKARECETGEDEQEYFSFKMEDLLNYASSRTDLAEKVKTYFPSYASSDFNCESMLSSIYKEEIKAMKRKTGFYVDSLRIKEVNEYNEKIYRAYVKKQCQPYTDLRNCMIDKNYDAKMIYNMERKKRGKKKVKSSSDLPDTYQPDSSGR